MPENPEDNLIIRMLREVRGKLESQESKIDELGSNMEALRRDVSEIHESVIYGLGLSSSGHLKNRELDARLDEQSGWTPCLIKLKRC